MKAIETKWKGYRFRSRTEARWAVFFDRANIKAQYEPEGVVLPSGPYLPDFYLPDLGVWVEIKGEDPTPEEMVRCIELHRATMEMVLLIVGPPDIEPQIIMVGDYWANKYEVEVSDAEHLLSENTLRYFFIDYGQQSLALESGQSAADNGDAPTDMVGCRWLHSRRRVHGGAGRPILGDRCKAAYDAARSARFEFGDVDQRWEQP